MIVVVHMPNDKGQKFEIVDVISLEITRVEQGKYMIQYMLDDKSGEWYVVRSEKPRVDVR